MTTQLVMIDSFKHNVLEWDGESVAMKLLGCH